ncbi:MAG TPA: ABC transporter substrate-binding protein, partial [Marinobacter hydrocarbonoclasticus]|nr:ABC transporter substrate-binding protein [Marinobacter nauticus]
MTCRTLTPKQTLLRSIAVLALSAMGAGNSLADSRSVETAYGPVTVNGQPERVVTL